MLKRGQSSNSSLISLWFKLWTSYR